MKQCIRTAISTFVYDENNEMIFQCARELEDIDLVRFVNEYRMLVNTMETKLPFVDDDTKDLRNVEGKELIGYWRMYWRNGYWNGRWMLEDGKPSEIDCIGVNKIIDWFCKNYPKGCNWIMKDDFQKNFKVWGSGERYLIKPFKSNIYKVMVDTTYGNGDYPVRVYVYKNKEVNYENI